MYMHVHSETHTETKTAAHIYTQHRHTCTHRHTHTYTHTHNYIHTNILHGGKILTENYDELVLGKFWRVKIWWITYKELKIWMVKFWQIIKNLLIFPPSKFCTIQYKQTNKHSYIHSMDRQADYTPLLIEDSNRTLLSKHVEGTIHNSQHIQY